MIHATCNDRWYQDLAVAESRQKCPSKRIKDKSYSDPYVTDAARALGLTTAWQTPICGLGSCSKGTCRIRAARFRFKKRLGKPCCHTCHVGGISRELDLPVWDCFYVEVEIEIMLQSFWKAGHRQVAR